MKRLFLIGVMVLTAVAGFAQSGERIDTLKERQKVLKITTKLNKTAVRLREREGKQYRTQQESSRYQC